MITNERKSNFELLRIVCMIMVITVHTLGHGGALNNTNIESLDFIILHMIESLSIVGVNCYVLISGYFGVYSTFKISKIISLYKEVFFYSISIPILFWSIRVEKISAIYLMKSILPITMQTWWFMTIFFIMYVFTPYINILIKNITLNQFKLLLTISFFVFVLWPSLSIVLNPIDSSGGYSLYSFIYMYVIGAYIRIFYEHKEISRKIALAIYFISSSILGIINVTISKIIGKNWGMYSYNFILVFISSIALFLYFKNINIKSKIINKLATLTLGVYLIHDHDYIRKILYNIFEYDKYFNKNNFLIYTLFVIISIYIISSIIELSRQYVIKHMIYYKKVRTYKFTNIINKINQVLNDDSIHDKTEYISK